MTESNTIVVETEDTDETVSVAEYLRDATFDIFKSLLPICSSRSWKSWEVSEQQEFAAALGKFAKVAGDMRSQFDKAVWEGHDDGSVSADVESIRTRSDGKTPGRKAKELTVEEMFDKL